MWPFTWATAWMVAVAEETTLAVEKPNSLAT